MLNDRSENEFVFVVKISKFCNLRCLYCYEHRELHLRENMPLGTIQRLLEDVDRFGAYLREKGERPKFSFVWHGGEPLLLQPDIYSSIAELQHKYIQDFDYSNSVQTNLYGGVKETLKFVLDSDWELSVSIDFAHDVRKNGSGKDSNKSVIANAESLCRSGARLGVISVLGTHNGASLPNNYEWVSEFAEGWRILPIFEGGPAGDVSRLRLPDEEVVRVLLDTFKRRANSSKHVPIAPIDDYIKCAALKIVGQKAAVEVTRELLDNIYVINVNGDVYTRPFAYDPDYCLGNINRSSMLDLIAGKPYLACQRSIQARKVRNCAGCNLLGFCDASPMHEHGSVSTDSGRCLVPSGAMHLIEQELLEAGVDSDVISTWAQQRLTV